MSDKQQVMAAEDRPLASGWVRARRVAGFVAAGTMSLYLVVKIVWVIGAFIGAVPQEFGANMPEWIALNVVTIGMAGLGVALGLALAQEWGKRIPAWIVILFAWAASGFLVSLLPYSVLSALLGAAGGGSGGDPVSEPFPAWDLAFIGVGFTGMALGLIVAVPVYMRERWPAAFTGRSRDARAASGARLGFALAATAVPVALWTYWAAGGTAGLNPDALDLWNRDSRLLVGTSAAWAVLGAWSVCALGRGRLPMWLPMTLGFVASGSLFAWNAWRILWLLLPITDLEPLKSPWVAGVEHVLSMAAGLAMMSILLRAYRR
ncbi:hypothetical protein [Glycomyces sp. NPDC048151]|uniref:hypothetical protein n=1 Tax=Glycomyces sp. NPDC048151 TaxID=3364002 RepID=UPI0037206395